VETLHLLTTIDPPPHLADI